MSEAQLSDHYDVVIAGGGMVGLALALTLDRTSAGRLRILVAEGFDVGGPSAAPPAYRPSFDARASALSYGSSLIMEGWGIWPALTPHLAPITRIHVSERRGFGHSRLSAAERGWPALGYVVENAWLGQAMLAAARACEAISLVSPAEVVAFAPGVNTATVTLRYGGTETPVRAGLLAVAAGADSGLHDRLGIHRSVRHYGRHALIANVTCRRPHDGWAYERFTDWGPMALLPLNDAQAARETHAPSAHTRMALVWTMPPLRCEQLQHVSDGEFLRTLETRFGLRQGPFTRVGQRHAYPLRLTRATEQVRHQLVLVGNAAHSLHPVAGQGFNLALRDVQRLAEAVSAAHATDTPLGALPVLQRYLAAQGPDQDRTIGFSDRIGELFEHPLGLLSHGRRLGLLALDLTPRAKRAFIDHGAGYHAGAPLGTTP